MRGVILRETGKPVEVSDDLTVRRPGPGEVRVRLRAAGVCHSDLSMCEGRLPARLPLIPGHEGAGEVVELGPGVSGPPVGTHVILSWIPPCGTCYLCLGGQPNLCLSARPSGPPTHHLGGEPAHAGLGVGCFAEETVVDARATIRQAWRATRRGGTTVVVGAGSADDMVSFSAAELFATERRLLGCLYGSGDVRTDFARLLRLWRAGRLDLDGLISRRIGLDDVGDAFAAMGSGDVIRSLVTL